MRALRPLLLTALVVGIAVTILMEASVIGPRRVPTMGQTTGYGGEPQALPAREFVIEPAEPAHRGVTEALGSAGGVSVLLLLIGAVLIISAVGSWFFLRRRRAAS